MKAPTTELYAIKSGVAVPLTKDEPNTAASKDGDKRYLNPTGAEVIVIPAPKWHKAFESRRVVIYPENSPRPWPLGSNAVMQPDALRTTDVQTLLGKFVPNLIRRALYGVDTKMRPAEIIAIIVSGLAFICSAVGLWFAYKIYGAVF